MHSPPTPWRVVNLCRTLVLLLLLLHPSRFMHCCLAISQATCILSKVLRDVHLQLRIFKQNSRRWFSTDSHARDICTAHHNSSSATPAKRFSVGRGRSSEHAFVVRFAHPESRDHARTKSSHFVPATAWLLSQRHLCCFAHARPVHD